MSMLIRAGTVITDSLTFQTDILIENGKIIRVDQSISEEPQMEVINASGKMVLPGGVDAHVHLDLPMFGTVSADDHYTGTKAAAFGGTTTVIDFIPQNSAPLLDNFRMWNEKASSRAAVDYGFHMNITRLDKKVEMEIPDLVEKGITSIKVFTAYNGRLRLQDGEIFKVMRIAGKAGILTLLHAENGDVIDILVSEALASGATSTEMHAKTRPAWGAVESVLRGVALSAQAHAPLYVVHMNTAGELDQLRYARSLGLPVMGETCPQYLLFTEAELQKPDGAKYVCSPPLRKETDQKILWKGLGDGSIQVISTDHCPFFYNGTKPINYEGMSVAIPGKELGRGIFTKIPNGLPGLGDRLPVIWTEGVGKGRITANQFVALTSTNPAKIFGLYPKKGTIKPGSDADIVIWDPNKKVTYGVKIAQHRTDYNLYEGWCLRGFPEKVILRGRIIVDSGQWLGKAGQGQFLHRLPFSGAL